MFTLAAGARSLALITVAAMAGCAVLPTPLSQELVESNAWEKRQRVTAEQEPVSGAITLHQAMARAIKYNLDHKVEIFDGALRTTELDLAHYNLLPNLVATTGYAERDKPNGSSSYNLVTNTQNFGFSTSQDERLRNSDLSFSWHILDFGLSYVRAQQAADKALIAEESRRKVVHRLMEDVRTSYWRAFSAQKLVARLRSLEVRTKAALAGSRSLADERTTSPLTAITYRRELIEIQRTLQELQRELSVSRFQLAALMNVDPGQPFKLAAPATHNDRANFAGDAENLVLAALVNRPEMRDVAYRQRINVHEAKAALLEMLPGIQLYAGTNFDSNSFLLHDQWLNWGAKASWNVLKVFQYPARRGVVDAQDRLLDQRALALTMAIMTQVHVSRARIMHLNRELTTAKTYHATQQELLGTIRSEFKANRVSEQTLLREELNAAVGEVRLDIARASLHSASANLSAAIGRDPLGVDVGREGSIAEIATAISVHATQSTHAVHHQPSAHAKK